MKWKKNVHRHTITNRVIDFEQSEIRISEIFPVTLLVLLASIVHFIAFKRRTIFVLIY